MGDDSARGIYRVQVSGRTLCNGSVPIPLPVLWRQPSTWAMMLIGFAGLGYLGYRQALRVA